ncbi:hypothetical protein NQ314_019494 [Rhamnusium bicolor]|uniref:Ribonuclease n=1 Tax=Rhamnusium bicolor TaxID=1586634 RepID=A0AAV8WMM7_9CUCU|nr:hypothetical protein NQ314_019494 [Rhamnusium bicolor]
MASFDSTDLETIEINSLNSLQSFLSERDNSQNIFYISGIPDVCKEFPCILGIDEAGRGPVLGPMVYGTAFCPINEQMVLETLECADSKALNEEKRDVIFSNICESSKKVGWAVEVIAPNSICNSMLSRSKYSLNQVSMDAAIGLIRAAINCGVKIEHIYVDTVGKPEKYQEYLKGIFPKYKITVAKKADSTYPIIQLRKNFLVDYCDPVFGYPQLVRFSWSTSVNALEETAYHVEFEEEDTTKTPPPVNNTSITSFFKMTPKKSIIKKQHEFFSQRFLSRKVEL